MMITLGAYTAPPASILPVLQNASASSGVPLNILEALAYQESSYNPNAVPPNCTGQNCGQGLLQVTPATGKSLGLDNPFDPQANADAGASYLASLYAQYGDWNTALIAYNQGPGALASKGPYSSSQQYASTILTNAGVDTSSAAVPAPVSSPDSQPGDITEFDTTGITSSGGLSSTDMIAIAAAGGLLLLILARR